MQHENFKRVGSNPITNALYRVTDFNKKVDKVIDESLTSITSGTRHLFERVKDKYGNGRW